MQINRTEIGGYLAKDPIVKEFQNGNSIAQVTIGCNDSYFSSTKNHVVERTQYFNAIIKGKNVDRIQKHSKGSGIVVYGKLRNRNYQSSDGTVKYITELHVSGQWDDLQLYSSKTTTRKEEIPLELDADIPIDKDLFETTEA